ncbi:MAG: hypothetical protein U0Z26_18605 [Anaerolineales bacterium]
MFANQNELDHLLDRQHTIQVQISPENPLPHNHAYAGLLPLAQTGFTFTPRQLLHAIGNKTVAIPANNYDQAAQFSLLYANILDLEGDHLTFRGDYDSDLKTARSQEIGIAFMCLIAQKHLSIPWDQLGSLPGTGKRFDYRGEGNGLQCILEAKGTSSPERQRSQIVDGISKKEAHHNNGEHFDIELIVSSYVGWNNGSPRIILADPDKSSFQNLYKRGDDRYYRLKHYCRVLQYIGLPESANKLNRFTLKYLDDRNAIYQIIMEEKSQTEFLSSITIDGDVFLGRWFSDWFPEGSKRYKKLSSRKSNIVLREKSSKIRVFQGVRRDIYRSLFTDEPFSQNLLSSQVIDRYSRRNGSRVSVFPDGTIMMFEQR